ncbi:NfeD family protein [Micromonospora mirobrigensis]|uniref:NfeD family protein n=1 Tax=Micromonospora mirobrigensis TaxID=262898 RepID=UPI001FDF6276|nr:NfeD family protein [Micromonospora mirobrigensis]
MATGTLIFLVIGGAGVAVLALGLLGTGLLHLGSPDVDGPVSLETVAGFVGAFGFGAAIVNELLGGRTPGMLAVAVAGGAFAAVPTAWLASRLSRAARDMRTDPTPTRDHLVGATGLVVTPVPTGGYGEVRVRLAGQPVKLNARADRPIPVGARIFVVEALSETSVQVETY